MPKDFNEKFDRIFSNVEFFVIRAGLLVYLAISITKVFSIELGGFAKKLDWAAVVRVIPSLAVLLGVFAALLSLIALFVIFLRRRAPKVRHLEFRVVRAFDVAISHSTLLNPSQTEKLHGSERYPNRAPADN